MVHQSAPIALVVSTLGYELCDQEALLFAAEQRPSFVNNVTMVLLQRSTITGRFDKQGLWTPGQRLLAQSITLCHSLRTLHVSTDTDGQDQDDWRTIQLISQQLQPHSASSGTPCSFPDLRMFMVHWLGETPPSASTSRMRDAFVSSVVGGRTVTGLSASGRHCPGCNSRLSYVLDSRPLPRAMESLRRFGIASYPPETGAENVLPSQSIPGGDLRQHSHAQIIRVSFGPDNFPSSRSRGNLKKILEPLEHVKVLEMDEAALYAFDCLLLEDGWNWPARPKALRLVVQEFSSLARMTRLLQHGLCLYRLRRLEIAFRLAEGATQTWRREEATIQASYARRLYLSKYCRETRISLSLTVVPASQFWDW